MSKLSNQIQPLSSLPNIGEIMVKRLATVGINNAEELKKLGSKEAFIRLRLNEGDTCFCSLCGLEGAIQNIRWHYLSDETKKDLKQFYKIFK